MVTHVVQVSPDAALKLTEEYDELESGDGLPPVLDLCRSLMYRFSAQNQALAVDQLLAVAYHVASVCTNGTPSEATVPLPDLSTMQVSKSKRGNRRR